MKDSSVVQDDEVARAELHPHLPRRVLHLPRQLPPSPIEPGDLRRRQPGTAREGHRRKGGRVQAAGGGRGAAKAAAAAGGGRGG